jgi:hypothetical protein
VTDFDDDPEDAWDDDDPFEEKVTVLERVITALRLARGDRRHDLRRADALRLIAKLEALEVGFPDSERIVALRAALEES